MVALGNLTQEATTTYTSSAFTLGSTGAWSGGYQNFANLGLPVGSVVPYKAVDSAGNVETGYGTWSAVGTLQRTQIEASNNGGAAAAFTGSVTVVLTAPSSWVQAPTRSVASGTSDTATAADIDGTIFWTSTATGARTQVLPTPTAILDGRDITVVDEAQNWGTNGMTFSSASGTVNGSATEVVNITGSTVTWRCHYSTNNWVMV